MVELRIYLAQSKYFLLVRIKCHVQASVKVFGAVPRLMVVTGANKRSRSIQKCDVLQQLPMKSILVS